jgi:hypothetical protein
MQKIASRQSWSPGRVLAAGIAAVLVTSLGLGTAAAIERQLAKGAVPFGSGGSVTARDVPDYVTALDRQGNPVGYVKRDALGVFSGRPDDAFMPVYADDLKTVVGHMVTGRGFVPVGSSDAAVPTFEVTTSESSPNP